MRSAEKKPARARDRQAAEEAILDAAERVFAEHGFDGARVDAVAAAAGYNKSLLFQYYGDKLGLYAAVLARATRDANALRARVLAPLLEDASLATDAARFRELLGALAGALFDHLTEHPRRARMLLWETAEGWQTFTKVASRMPREHAEQYTRAFERASRAGVLRSRAPAHTQLAMALQVCLAYLGAAPLVSALTPPAPKPAASARARAKARAYVVQLIVAGMMHDRDASAV